MGVFQPSAAGAGGKQVERLAAEVLFDAQHLVVDVAGDALDVAHHRVGILEHIAVDRLENIATQRTIRLAEAATVGGIDVTAVDFLATHEVSLHRKLVADGGHQLLDLRIDILRWRGVGGHGEWLG